MGHKDAYKMIWGPI